jgi:hypothetical protein
VRRFGDFVSICTKSPRTAILCLAAIALFGQGREATAGFIVGGTGNDNVFPFGLSAYVGEYQQVYSHTALGSSPFTVTSVAFETVPSSAGISTSEDVQVSLSTTSATPTTLSTDYAANRGPDNQIVFSGVLSFTALGNGTFDFVINFTSPFAYNPAKGNLLLDVDVITPSSSPTPIGFVAGKNSLDSARVFNFGGNGAPTVDSTSLSTSIGTSAAVPEPATLTLSGISLVLTGLGVWRARTRS